MDNRLDQGIAQYQQRRDAILATLESYRAWLERYTEVESGQSLRLYDLAESLKRDKLLLAFVAEFSRGKSELINALFFADLKQRLLPSDVGRTTMCPTELFYDADSEPYLRLLPIETRLRDDSISRLKRLPIEWSSVRLDPEDAQQMSTALRALADVKRVAVADALAMGLCDASDAEKSADGKIEVPAWRYAMINFPHPLLKSGLAILDTPGLNALGTEPELTLNTIPNAHGVLFLLSTDTGVTRSDLEVWENSVRHHANHHVAILNKVDMLWDELKTDAEIAQSIHKQKEQTAQQLQLREDQVIALSAQKALLGKIRGDQALVTRSGIGVLESLLADKIIPARQAMLYQSVCAETHAMANASRQSVSMQLDGVRQDLEQLSAFSGKNREIVTNLRDKLIKEKSAYDATTVNFKITRTLIQEQGRMLLDALSEEVLDEMLVSGRASLEDCWTTPGLVQGMNDLFAQIIVRFHEVEGRSTKIVELLDAAYLRFHQEHGFPLLSPPQLTMDNCRQKMAVLMQQVNQFGHDPVNLIMEKRFMVKKFYLSLVAEAQGMFGLARSEADSWLRRSLDPVVMRIRDHKKQLEIRIENIKQVHDNLDNLLARTIALKAQQAALEQQQREIAVIVQSSNCMDASDSALTI
ncbi:dynamin family protein [Sulfuriferula thiophila]|uniref:dynamin family protein n=1 Tax=Sulfuriferula thiophila TaxID=1781211 RepID=UPI000F609660|nr:dynamin family protein [Sulfuriferula thiophila]